MSAHQSTGKKAIWFILAGCVAVALAVVLGYRAFMKPRQLVTYFARLQPGMSYSEVTQLMPRAMITADKQTATSVVWQTVLVRSNVAPSSEIICSGDAFPLGGIEAGRIYFD